MRPKWQFRHTNSHDPAVVTLGVVVRSPSVPLGMFVILVMSHNECRPPAIKPSALLRLSGDHSHFFIVSAKPQTNHGCMIIDFTDVLAKNILGWNLRMGDRSGTFSRLCSF